MDMDNTVMFAGRRECVEVEVEDGIGGIKGDGENISKVNLKLIKN